MQNVAEINDFGGSAKYLTFFYQLIFLVVFVVYTNSNTKQIYTERYLSLQGTDKETECTAVPLTVSATY